MRTFLLLATVLIAQVSPAQELLNWKQIGSVSQDTAAARIAATYPAKYMRPIAESGYALYKVRYSSRDMANKPVALTGLVAIPQGGAPKGLVVFCHGTVSDPDAVPSRYTGVPTPGETEWTALQFATAGYAVAMPDYLGLGDHKGVHPYPLSKVNAVSAVDIIRPARQLAKTAGPNLFITGYSEGGAIAMATVQRLESLKSPEYKVTASAPMSGNYDISNATLKSIASSQRNPAWLAVRVYLMGYVGYSLSKVGPKIRLKDYFTKSFASYLPYVFETKMTDNQRAIKLTQKGTQVGVIRTIRKALTPRFWNDIQKPNYADPVIRVLAQNDCHDWTVTTPMYLLALKDDYVVTSENAKQAIRAMRKRGVGDDLLRYYRVPDLHLDHIKGVPVTLNLARQFFEGGFPSVPFDPDPK